MRRKRVLSIAFALAVAAWAAACYRAPSDAPLGVGPLARAEASARATAKERQLEAERAEQQRAREQTLSSWDSRQPEEEADTDDAEDYDGSAPEEDEEEDTASKPDESEDEKDEEGAALVAADLAGEYLGEDSSVYHLEGLPERREHDENARTRVEAGDDSTLTLVIVDSSSGDDLCAVEAELEGRVARVEAGQTCFDAENGPVSTSGRITSGKARFPKAERLLLDLEIDLELNAGDRSFSGKVMYHFDGERDD